MKHIFRFLPFLVLLLGPYAYATHLTGGHITAARDATRPNVYAYIFTLTLYREPLGVDQPEAELVITSADGSKEYARLKSPANNPRRRIGLPFMTANAVEEITYTVSYVFPEAGQYRISFTEENRNADIVNMTNSINTPFHIETFFVTDISLGINSTPLILNPLFGEAQVGKRYSYNPAAFDLEGDSLAYRIIVPHQSSTTPVANYKSPETVGPPQGTPESGQGSATFALNRVNGQLVWDSPGAFGIATKGFASYSIAMIVEEWRKIPLGKARKISETVHEIQVQVHEHSNKRPTLVIPQDTCVIAGTLLTATITASDPDAGQQVQLSSESAGFSKQTGVFPNQPSATLSVPNYTPTEPVDYAVQGNPARSIYSWQTDCKHVRDQPYDFVFRAADNPKESEKLTDVQVWRVTVAPPPPTGLTASVADGKNIRLDWQAYTACSNVAQLFVWRTENCQPHTLPACTQTVPPGYILVGTVPATATTFTDTFLASGASYSYRVSAGSTHALAFSAATSCLSVTTGPTGRITAPVHDDRYLAPKVLTIAAEASVPGGTVATVEFYNNFTKIGEDKTAPYTLDWLFSASGTYVLTAKIISATGTSGTTAPVTIYVEVVNGSEEDGKDPLTIYPIPAQKQVMVQYSQSIRKITAVTHLGVAIPMTFQKVGEKSWEVEMEKLPAGVYVLQIETAAGQKRIRKIVKVE